MDHIGRYKIEAKIGQGAMGAVYKAWHPGFDDFVALKTIQNSRLRDHELIDRFKVEGRALAKLKHQNIVQIYDADQADGIHFIVMEYMNGPGLDHLISNHEDIPLAKRLNYIVPICSALDYAHRRRLFHRDIKPANIMLQHDDNDEVVKVVDFGIARLLDFSQTSTNLFIGAPAYMAPELLTAADKANEKTDIWALGVTLYELISYRRPFEGRCLEDLKCSIVNDEPKSLSQLISDCPEDLQAVVSKMMAKDPAARYQIIEEVLYDLEPIARRLCSEAAAVLIRRASELYEIGDLSTAKFTLNEAKKYDASHTNIKELLFKIQDELHRKELIPRLQGHLKRGREHLDSGALREARTEAQAALGLDSRSEPAQKLLREVEQAIARIQLAEEKIRLTKQRLSEGLLTQAEELLTEAEGLDNANPQLRELKRQVNEERQKRDRRKRLNQILNQARALLSGLDYDECLAQIVEGLKEFPGNTELRKVQEMARAELAELEKQRLRQREIGESRALIAQEDFDSALIRIEQLLKLYPGDPNIKNLQTVAAEGVHHQKKRKRLEAGISELRELFGAENYRAVAAQGEILLQEFPQERQLQDMVSYALAEITEEESRQKQLIRENNIRELLKVADFSAVELEASRAVEEHPGNINFRTLLGEAIRAKKRKEEQEELLREAERRTLERARRESEERRIEEARALIERGDLAEAEALLEDLTSNSVLGPRDERIRMLCEDIEEKKHILELRNQQLQRRKENEARCITAIRELLNRGDLSGAMQFLMQSVQEQVLSPSDEQVRQLQSEIEEKRKEAEQRKQQEKRCRNEQESRIQSTIDLIDRGEWDEATRVLQVLSREPLAPMLAARIEHLQREIHEKKQFKEFCRQTEQRRKEGQEHTLQEIAATLQRNDLRGAARLLNQALHEGLLTATDERVIQLQRDIDERTRLAESKKREEQRKRELEDEKIREVRALVEKGDFAEATRLLDGATQRGVFSRSDEIAQKLQAEIKEAERHEELRQKEEQKRAEIQDRQVNAIRALFEKADYEGAIRLLDEATMRADLVATDERIARLRAEIEAKMISVAAQKEEERRAFAQELAQKTQDIRNAIATHEFAFAIRLADEFEWKYGRDTSISDLRRQAEQDAEQSTRQERERVLQQASERLDVGDFATTELLITSNLENGVLRKEDPRVATLIRRTLEFKDIQKNWSRERKRDGLAEARKLLAGRQFDECLALLGELRREFWDDTEISDVIRSAESGKNKVQEFNKIAALLENQQLTDARKALESFKKRYSQDAAVKQLQERLSKEEETQRRKEQLEGKLASLRKSFDSGKWKEVVKSGKACLQAFPEDPRVEELVNSAKAELASQQQTKQKKDSATDTRVPVLDHPGSATTPGFLATDPVSTSIESLANVEQRIEPQTATDSSPESALEAAEAMGLPATGPNLQSVPSLCADALSVVERHLATFIGPLAILIVKNARISWADPEKQFAMLASSVRDPQDNQAFLSRKDEILRCLADLPPMKGLPFTQTMMTPIAPRNSAELTPAAVQRASELLTQYLGPISRILTDRAANRAESLQALYLMLAEHLRDTTDRTRFLSDAGFPQE
jgi:serine/threonine protein kinase